MKSRLLGISLSLSVLFAAACSGGSSAKQTGIHANHPQALRILPLGDSITQANHEHMGYRFWLWKMLAEEGLATNFVGTQDSNYQGNPDYPSDFDLNHEGHWGWRSDEVLAMLPEWLQHYDADIALIHLGTNDCLQSQAPQETLGELSQIITLVREDNPNTKLVLSPLGPTTWQGSACLEEVNQGLLSLQQQLSTANSPIILTTTDQTLDPSKHLYDGLHPNAQGEQHMATAWLSAIKSLLNTP